MSSICGGVTSSVIFFSSTASLPLPQCQSEASWAFTRSTAGPSLMPETFARLTAIFLFPVAAGYCSEASVCSAPPWLKVTVTDLRPAPRSVTSISTGTRPSMSEAGVTLISGGWLSRRARKIQAPAAMAAMMRTKRLRRTRAARPYWALRAWRRFICGRRWDRRRPEAMGRPDNSNRPRAPAGARVPTSSRSGAHVHPAQAVGHDLHELQREVRRRLDHEEEALLRDHRELAVGLRGGRGRPGRLVDQGHLAKGLAGAHG